MKSITRTALLAFVVLALGAVSAASASATLPEFNNRTSSTVKFSGESKLVEVESKGGEYACDKNKVTGEIEPGKTKTMKNVVLTFESCSNSFCSLTTTTKSLTGTLGYIGSEEVGLLLKPASGPVAECTFPFSKGSIVGSIIMQIRPLGKETAKLELVARQSKGRQELTHFEGETETHNLEFVSSAKEERLNGPLGIEWGALSLNSEHDVEIEV